MKKIKQIKTKEYKLTMIIIIYFNICHAFIVLIRRRWKTKSQMLKELLLLLERIKVTFTK